MDGKLKTLLGQLADGRAGSPEVARFLARYTPVLGQEAIINELEYRVAEISMGEETEASLKSFARRTLVWQ